MSIPGLNAPPSSVNILNDKLNSNRKRDISAVLSGPAAGGILSDKFMRGLGNERTRLLSKNTAVTAPKPGETGTPGLLNEMGFHTGEAAYPDQPRRTVPGTISNTEKQTNSHTPVQRIVHSPAGGSIHDLPSRYELSWAKKARVTNAIQFQLDRASNMVSKLDTLEVINTGNTALINTHPQLALNGISYMNYMHEQLNKLAQTNPERLRRLDCRQIFHGVPDLSWTGWTIDGIVSLEQDMQRHSTARGDQYSGGRNASGQLRPPYMSDSKILTITASGQEDMLDYFDSRGVQEGSSLWCIFKEYDPIGPSGDNSVQYVRSRKAAAIQNGGNNVTASVKACKVEISPGLSVPTKAPGLFFVADPTGGELDPSFALYTNEWGDVRMGKIFFLGRVLFLPPRFQQQYPPIYKADSQLLHALTDGMDLLVRERLTVLYPTYHDGTLNMY